MELRHLRYFVAAAEEASFGRAANRLNVSKPAVGQQIRQLEEELGVRLFERLRRMRLTTGGKAFLADAQRLLAELEHSVDHVRRVARGDVGLLRLAHVPSMPRNITRILEAFCTRHPNVNLHALEL